MGLFVNHDHGECNRKNVCQEWGSSRMQTILTHAYWFWGQLQNVTTLVEHSDWSRRSSGSIRAILLIEPYCALITSYQPTHLLCIKTYLAAISETDGVSGASEFVKFEELGLQQRGFEERCQLWKMIGPYVPRFGPIWQPSASFQFMGFGYKSGQNGPTLELAWLLRPSGFANSVKCLFSFSFEFLCD